MMKKEKGITIIALIITIIILLILAAVVIDVAIDGHLIDTAKSAVEETNNKVGQMQVESDELIGILEDELNGISTGGTTGGNTTGGSETEEELNQKEPIEAGERANETTTYTVGNKIAVIPEGFTVSGYTGNGDASKDETTIDGGLVIYDIPANVTINWNNPSEVDTARITYDQFVWIPVNFEKQQGATYLTDTNFNNVWKRSAWGNNARVTTPTSTSFPNSTDWPKFTEPYSYNSNDFDGEGSGKTGITRELNAMKQSVYTYGGFYIARYEAGTDVERTGTSTTTISTLKFVQDAYPYNWVCWGDQSKNTSAVNYGMGDIREYGAVALSRNINFKSGSTAVTSMLCSGVAWDAMVDFVKDTNHNVTNSITWGNYYDSNFTINRQVAIDWKGISTKATNRSVLLTTGASEQNKAKNIYDIAGNCYEWTTEAQGYSSRVLRGGSYDNYGSDIPASYRGSNYPCNSVVKSSFRPVLYINL